MNHNLFIKTERFLYNIHFVGCSDYVSNPNNLRIFQWNILSQALGQMNDNFARCPDEALEWNTRRYLIVEEIVEYCPDIICLQVQSF